MSDYDQNKVNAFMNNRVEQLLKLAPKQGISLTKYESAVMVHALVEDFFEQKFEEIEKKYRGHPGFGKVFGSQKHMESRSRHMGLIMTNPKFEKEFSERWENGAIDWNALKAALKFLKETSGDPSPTLREGEIN